MGSGKLNIWIRDEDCSLRNAWNVVLEIKTCIGEHLFDTLPSHDLAKILTSLKDIYPSTNVSYGAAYNTKGIIINEPQSKRIINNIPVNVPPGCYVVRIHICGGGNEWSDRIMVIVSCESESCVNLIIKRAETCFREAVIPLMRVAEIARIPRDQVQIAVNVLRKAGEIPITEITRNLTERVELLREFKVPEASEIVSQAESGIKLIRELELKEKKTE